MSPTTTIPPTGWYDGIPDATYHSWDCISAHRLMMLERGLSPAHVRESIDQPDEDTPARAFGRALHLAVLQPDAFAAQTSIGPVNPRTQKCYARDTDAWRAAQEEQPGVTLMLPEERERVLRVSEAVRRHPTMRQLLACADNHAEWTGIVQTEMEDGSVVRTKIRLDLAVPELRAIVDLKTCECAARPQFERALFNFQYHLQAGIYANEAEALDFPTDHYLIAAIEKQPPYACAIYRLSPDVLAWAWNRMQEPIGIMARCYITGTWPSYSTEVEDIALPEWAMRRVHAAIATEGGSL